jgi:putative SOS response-associated peptidase YedK
MNPPCTRPDIQACTPRHHGCAGPTDGFGASSQPIHFRLADGNAFGFAGLWTCKTDDEGEPVESCTIIATSPNELGRETVSTRSLRPPASR